MTPQEKRDFETRAAWLPPEHAAQWTYPVRETWLAMRKAYKAWQLSGTAPDVFCGSIKHDGDLTPVFIVNEPFVKYEELKAAWRVVEPKYIYENRARMSNGDFGEADDWTQEEK
jgi:hypothetical protein